MSAAAPRLAGRVGSPSSNELLNDKEKNPAPPAQQPVPSAVVFAILQFAVSSVVMVAGNKAAVQHLPHPCTLVIIQAVGTLVLLAVFYRSQVSLNTATVMQWLPISMLFTTMLFTSMKSMVHSTVSTILVLRNIGPIFTTLGELMLGKLQISGGIAAAELLIVCGAVLYTGGAVDTSPQSLFWILINVAAQVTYGLMLKHTMETSPIVKEMSKFTMSFYNNLLCLPPVLLMLFLYGEHTKLTATEADGTPSADAITSVSPWGWGIIALTCVFGFVISTSGFGVQRLVSATSFLVLNNVTKFANIFFGIVVMGDKVYGTRAVSGCILALGAGATIHTNRCVLSTA